MGHRSLRSYDSRKVLAEGGWRHHFFHKPTLATGQRSLWLPTGFNGQNSIKFRPICADTTLAHVSFECTKVEEVNPDLVVRDNEETPYSMRYVAIGT